MESNNQLALKFKIGWKKADFFRFAIRYLSKQGSTLSKETLMITLSIGLTLINSNKSKAKEPRLASLMMKILYRPWISNLKGLCFTTMIKTPWMNIYVSGRPPMITGLLIKVELIIYLRTGDNFPKTKNWYKLRTRTQANSSRVISSLTGETCQHVWTTAAKMKTKAREGLKVPKKDKLCLSGGWRPLEFHQLFQLRGQ
jgi:hypothetical protein